MTATVRRCTRWLVDAPQAEFGRELAGWWRG